MPRYVKIVRVGEMSKEDTGREGVGIGRRSCTL